MRLRNLITWSTRVLKCSSLIAVIGILGLVCNAKLEKLKLDAQYAQANIGTSVQERTQQLECLTRNIYYEAGSEPFEGKVAVAQVTLNRVESGRFASSLCGVVYQKNVVYDKIICQFSWYCENASRIKPTYAAAWRESEEVAKRVLLENFRLPSLKSALYFHNDTIIPPQWRKQKVAKIGHHTFYADNN